MGRLWKLTSGYVLEQRLFSGNNGFQPAQEEKELPRTDSLLGARISVIGSSLLHTYISLPPKAATLIV